MRLNQYQQSRGVKQRFLGNIATVRGGKMHPTAAERIGQSEFGVVRQDINIEMAPIPGRLLSPITATIQCVFVPHHGMYAFANPEDPVAGHVENFRDLLKSGAEVFPMVPPNNISNHLNIVPKSIDGQKYVCSSLHYGYNLANNHLRRRIYDKAALVHPENTWMQNALFSKTILQRLNAVLDPDERVYGDVSLSGRAPVSGVGFSDWVEHTDVNGGSARETSLDQTTAVNYEQAVTTDTNAVRIRLDEAGVRPQIFAEFQGSDAGFSLADLARANSSDALVRQLAALADRYPEQGEEMLANVTHGLSVEMGRDPYVMYEKDFTLQSSMMAASDGASLLDDVSVTHLGLQKSIAVVVPQTEFGGILYTFVSIKPDEVVRGRPHPDFTIPFTGRNFAADELRLDPEPVQLRELDSNCAQEDENAIACYVGPNHLEKTYSHYGFSPEADVGTVEKKTSIWQVVVPLSVTPDNIEMPDIGAQVFADRLADVATISCRSMTSLNTPIIFGPTPVERLSLIADGFFEE